jgi:hypothetical protein
MIKNPLSLSGTIRPALYPIVAAALLAIQYGYVALCFHYASKPLAPDADFWVTPMPRLMDVLLPTHPAAVHFGFLVTLISSILLSIASFKRANGLRYGHFLALLAMIPTIQLVVIVALSFLWRSKWGEGNEPHEINLQTDQRQLLIGIATGMTLIVGSVIVSANIFGAYGLGLFVFTPLLVGFTTGYSVNTPQPISKSRTGGAVIIAGLLGTLALLMLALEGLMCIILIAPLAAVLGFFGGMIGRAVALAVKHPGHPIFSVAVLPLMFLADAALPPAAIMTARQDIVISASPDAVWRSLTKNRPVDNAPKLIMLSGLAYPIASQLSGEGVGALRIGRFSTGIARERVTLWQPGRALAFRGESHAPAMEEMSPYRIVHAPHVDGYFDTLDTRFTLTSLTNGQTRLTITSRHILRIEPIPYWQPIAEWAIGQNMRHVLEDVSRHARSYDTNTVSFASPSISG